MVFNQNGQGIRRQGAMQRHEGAPVHKVSLGDAEAAVGGFEYGQALAGLLGDEEAARCARPPADTAAQLVQRRQPKPLRALHHYHTRLRHIHPNLRAQPGD